MGPPLAERRLLGGKERAKAVAMLKERLAEVQKVDNCYRRGKVFDVLVTECLPTSAFLQGRRYHMCICASLSAARWLGAGEQTDRRSLDTSSPAPACVASLVQEAMPKARLRPASLACPTPRWRAPSKIRAPRTAASGPSPATAPAPAAMGKQRVVASRRRRARVTGVGYFDSVGVALGLLWVKRDGRVVNRGVRSVKTCLLTLAS